MLARCRYGACLFFYVRVLVLVEIVDLDELAGIGRIPPDELIFSQRRECRLDVHVLVREYLCLDSRRTVLQTPLPIGERPQSDEEETVVRLHLGKYFVLEECRLDASGSWHCSVFLFW